jgi:hypothetical protein
MKPKAIGYILLSYFQQDFWGILATVIAIFILVAASFTAVVDPGVGMEKIESIWHWLLGAYLAVLYISAAHMERLIASDANALLPHYRRYLLIALGLVMVVFLVWPVVITGIRGFPVLTSLAMFLFIPCLMIGGAFIGANIIVLGVMVWLGKLLHEMLGLKSKIMIFGDFSNFSLLGSKSVFPILVILFSGIVLYLFARNFLKASVYFSQKKTYIRSPFDKGYDKMDALTDVIFKRNMERLLKNNRDKKRSLFHISRLLQTSLFSPGYASITQALVSIAVIIFYVGTIMYVFGTDISDLAIIPTLLVFYYAAAGMISTDFLQHRQRMPLIWMQAQLNSRKAFAKATILTYVIVVVKQHLALSLGMLIMPVFFPAVSVLRLLPLIILGFLVFIILLSLSLLFSDQVLSPKCNGWLQFNIIVGILIFILARNALKLLFNTPGTWIFIIVLAVFTGFLLWRAYKKWSDTEFNFTGPQPQTQAGFGWS